MESLSKPYLQPCQASKIELFHVNQQAFDLDLNEITILIIMIIKKVYLLQANALKSPWYIYNYPCPTFLYNFLASVISSLKKVSPTFDFPFFFSYLSILMTHKTKCMLLIA